MNSALLLAPNIKCAILLDSLNSVLPKKLDRTDGGQYDERRKEAECTYRQGIAGMEQVVVIGVAKDVPLSQYEEVAAFDWKDPVKDLTAVTGFTSRVMVQVSLRSVRLFAWKDGFTVDALVMGESLTDDGYASFLKALIPHTLSPSDASPAPTPSAISANAGVCHVSAEQLAAAFTEAGSEPDVFSPVESIGQCGFLSQAMNRYVATENYTASSGEGCQDVVTSQKFRGGSVCVVASRYAAYFKIKGVNQYVRFDRGLVDDQEVPAATTRFVQELTALFGPGTERDCSYSNC